MCRYARLLVDEAKLCWVFPVIQKPATDYYYYYYYYYSYHYYY